MENPRIELYEHEVLLENGQIGWQQWVDRSLFDAAGRIAELQGVGRDVTARRQAEESLARRCLRYSSSRSSYTPRTSISERIRHSMILRRRWGRASRSRPHSVKPSRLLAPTRRYLLQAIPGLAGGAGASNPQSELSRRPTACESQLCFASRESHRE